ncbi:MAG: cytochrome c biogenesis protein CcsA [Fibrobacter sp.]|nr:cytochrome c biogenesis protein CcsA [Fibrobacter sp.]
MKKLSSLKFTAALLVAFLLLTFWGVLAQVNAESAGLSATVAVNRFFDSYFIWILGVIPLPAFKGLALLAALNVVASMIFRMPRGLKNAGLWLMHVALLFLLVGGVAESEIKREYNGYRDISIVNADLSFFAVDDSLKVTPIEIPQNDYAYSVHYHGRVDNVMGTAVDLYKATYDPLRFVPYAFMAMFLLGVLIHYAVKIRNKQVPKTAVFRILPFSVMLAALPMNAHASERPIPIWEALHSDTPVLVESSVRPFDSFARGFLDELSGHVKYKKLTAADVVRKILLAPEEARLYAIFKVLRSEVSVILHLPQEKRYVSYAELSPLKDLLKLYATRNDDHPATTEMRRLYSNVLLYESVADRSAFSIVSKNSLTHSDINYHRLKVEVLYHRLNLALWGFILALLAGILASLNVVFRSLKLDALANVLCIIATVALMVMLALRAYIASRPPMSSLYEIVLLVALLLVAFESGAFLFCKRRTYTLMIPVTLMATALLFFARFVLEPGDTFQPIPSVLNSSVFLTIHVFTIALGFAAMILSGVVAHLVLYRKAKPSPLYSLMDGTLAFGMAFTVLGTLLGGVWADFAWGRFWGFDPKECGALFVILWAMLTLHLRAGKLVSLRGFALMNCFNVIVTLLCWFGVNLLGVGLHSYGFQSGSVIWLASFVVVDVVVIIMLTFRTSQKNIYR